jgi:PAS domain S-box-containing protein
MAQAFLLVLVMAIAVAPSEAAPATEKHKSVLLLFSDEPNLPPQVVLEQAIRSTLKTDSPVSVEVYSEYLDSLRTRVDDYEKDLVGLLRRKYEGRKLDCIFAVSTSALRVLLKNQPEIFPDTPVVFFVLDQRNVAGLKLGPNMTGVWGEINFKPNLDLALLLHPNTRKVAVVAGISELDKYWTAKVQEDFRAYEGKLEITYLIGLTIPEQQQALSSLPPHTIVMFISSMRDSAGNNYGNPDVLRQISPASSAPIYGASDAQLGLGIVGGSLISFEVIGVQTAKLGLRVLAGEKPQAIAPHGIPNVVMFDWRELHRWGISEQNLPPGSIVRFKVPTLWEQYKWRIVGVISLCILEATLIVLLLVSRARRRQAEKESVRYARLAEAEHKKLDEVVSNTPGIVWESRLEPGTTVRKIEFVNDYVEQMLGYSVEECLATPNFWLSVIHKADREESARGVEAIFESGQEGVQQFRCVTKDGRTLWVEAHLVAISDETGKALGLRGVAMDITDRKRAEEALQKALTEVSQLKNQLQEENIYLQEEIKLAHNFDEIIGHSDAIKYVLYKIEQVAPTDSTVLITGETGTGKELVARAIHSASRRKNRPLVKVNCAALSASLIESELFGHERGAFTGAAARKIGRFELANDATIFLDEIGELPLELQVKLLRVIQEGEFERLGSSKTIKADVRIIAATNRNLQTEVQKGLFREDLYYRLNVFPITVPPLKQRSEDVPLLVEHFVQRFSKKLGKEITSVSPATLKSLREYSWPGNIRELANVIERAVINTQGEVLRLTDHFGIAHPEESSVSSKTLEEIEREHITRTLDDNGWRIEGPTGAAKILGLNPSTLRTRMTKLRIQKPQQSLV